MYAGNLTGVSSTRGFRLLIITSDGTGGTAFAYDDNYVCTSTQTINSWPTDISHSNICDRAEDRSYDWFRDFEHRKKPPLYLKNPPVLRGIRRIAKGPNKMQQYRAKRRKLLHLMRAT